MKICPVVEKHKIVKNIVVDLDIAEFLKINNNNNILQDGNTVQLNPFFAVLFIKGTI